MTPLLLAGAYHAHVDIPAMIADAGAPARQADVLGEDDRLLQVMHERLAEAGVSRHDAGLGVLVVAVGSSWDAVNARTAGVAPSVGGRNAMGGCDHRIRHRAAAVSWRSPRNGCAAAAPPAW